MIEAHFIHSCTIERATISLDDHGADVATWHAVVESVRCRLVVKDQRAGINELAERPIITTYRVLLPAYTTVQPGDRITNVYDERGVIDPGPYRIETILPRRARSQRHISVLLERVK